MRLDVVGRRAQPFQRHFVVLDVPFEAFFLFLVAGGRTKPGEGQARKDCTEPERFQGAEMTSFQVNIETS